MANTERYADIDDVPLTGPDPFEKDEKARALQRANAQLESDVNGGNRIESPEVIHNHAASSYATYVLVLGPKSPGSARAGDFADEGSERMAFAERILGMYERAVNSIIGGTGSGGDETDGGSGGYWEESVWTTREV